VSTINSVGWTLKKSLLILLFDWVTNTEASKVSL
jgi:hypothetical protein